MHPLEVVCCTQFSGIRKELAYEKTPNLGVGVPYSQSPELAFLKGNLF